MAGNVAEWCHDGYLKDLGSYDKTDPWGASSGYILYRMVRGGSFMSNTYYGSPTFLRGAARFAYPENGYLPTIGFRCVRSTSF